MVTKEEIREENLTTEDVIETEFAQHQESVEWVPEWDEYPEERPGENTRIEDDALLWERDGFEVRLESYETTHWRAELTIPERVGRFCPREFDLKCHPLPECGFVQDVTVERYVTTGAVLILQANFQPVFEVNNFIDSLLDDIEQSEAFEEEVQEGLAAARENQAGEE